MVHRTLAKCLTSTKGSASDEVHMAVLKAGRDDPVATAGRFTRVRRNRDAASRADGDDLAAAQQHDTVVDGRRIRRDEDARGMQHRGGRLGGGNGPFG